MCGPGLGVPIVATLALVGLIVAFGYEVAKALASPALGLVAANLLFVSAVSIWVSLRRGRQERPY